jgi:UbiD family decarboxylase
VNLGTFRVMVHDAKRVGVYISPGKHGRQFRDEYFKRREPCPILVVCGVDPLLFIASTLEVPQGVSEYDWAGGIRGEPYEVITEPVTGLPMPASAEIVLAGFLHHDKKLPEGPFGEWTGYYASGERAEPVLEVEAIYHRNDPIILGVPPNKPPYEPHRYREYLRSALLLRELKAAGGDLRALRVALTGRVTGPELSAILAALPREEALRRVDQALQHTQS